VLDTLKGTLSLSMDTPPETNETTVKVTITEKRDVSKETEEKNDTQQEKQIAVAVDNTRRESSSVSDSESKPSVMGILSNYIGWAVGIVILVVALVWWFFGIGKKKTKKNDIPSDNN